MKTLPLATRSRAPLAAALATAMVGTAAWTAGAGTLAGRVADSGRGVAGATVAAVPYESASDAARREARGDPAPPSIAAVSTSIDGRFLLKLPPGTETVQLRVEAQGAVPFRSVDVFDGGDTVDAGSLSVQTAAPLAGRVVGPQGKGVGAALVRLEPSLSGSRIAEIQTVRTGPDGSFRFQAASPSANRLDAVKDGFASASTTGVRAGPPVTISLGSAVALSGVVKRSDGRTPAGGALVRFEGGGRSRWVETAADGSFSIADAVAGPGRIVADGGSLGRGEAGAVAPTARAVTVVLERPARIAGRVVNARTLRPVPRVRVVAARAGFTGVGRSGADGRYAVEGLAAGTYALSVDEPSFVRYTRRGVRVERGQPFSADIPLTLGASLSGRVVDPEGKPIAGAEVRLSSREGGRPFGRFRARGAAEGESVRSRADGTFKAGRLPPGSNMQFTVSHPEFVRRVVGGISLAAGSAKAGLEIAMHRGLEVAGTVRDSDGRPVAGAEVALSPAPSEGRGGGGFRFGPGLASDADGLRATSGPDGRFHIAGLEAGAYALEARRDGFADARIEVVRLDPDAVPPSVDVWLLPGATISGAVRRPDGSGAKGFVVLARTGAGRGLPFGGGSRLPEPTSDDGLFTIGGLQSGETYTLTVLGGGGLPQEHPGILAPADGVDIAVGATGQIAGHVVDAATQKPVTSFRATYEAGRGPGGFGRGPGGRGGFLGRSRSGGDGDDDESPPSVDGSFVIDDVPPGTWTVVVDADGYETARVSDVTVKDGETSADVEVRATRGRVLSGRAVEAQTGRPVPGVSVTAARAAGGGPGGFGQAAALSDADGRFDIAGLAPGTYRVETRHPDYADASQIVDVQQDQAATEIRLSAGGALAGFVVSPSGAPIPGAAVSLRTGGGGGPRFGGGGQPSTTSDESGGFHVDKLAAGIYAVSASLGAQSSAPVEVPLLAGQSRQDVRVILGGGATLKGQVSGLAAELRGAVNVMADGPEGYFAAARPTADGAFSLSGVPEGSIHVRAVAGSFSTGTRTASAEVEIAQGQTEAQVDIVFDDGFSLSGTITRGGQPVSGVAVMARVAGQGPSATTRSDDGGSYVVAGLGEGDYTVEASPPRGVSQRQTVHMAGDQTLDFVLPPSGISGVVIEAGSGQPLAGARVTADAGAASQTRGAAAVTDSNGLFAIDGLDPQPCVVTVSLASYAFEKRTVDVGASSDPLRIELRRGEGLDVRALDAAFGVPLGSLFAEAKDAAGAAAFSGRVSLDSEGRGQVPSLRPGGYTVRLAAPGYAPLKLAVTVPSPALDLRFGAGGAVEVRSGPETLSRSPQARLVDSSGSPFATSPFEPDGWFALTTPVHRVEHVTPGVYTLAVGSGGATSVTVNDRATATIELP